MNRFAWLAIACFSAVQATADPTALAAAHSKAYQTAVNARDVKAVLALYAPDAHVVWPGQGQEASGKAEIEKLVAEFLKTYPKDAQMVLVSQIAVPLGDGKVATIGHWEETFTDADGKKQSAAIRTTEVIKSVKGKTLYVIDHASIGVSQ